MITNTNLVTFTCRFHPTNWWHELGCDHQRWTKDELRQAIDNCDESLKLIRKNAPEDQRRELRNEAKAKRQYLLVKLLERSEDSE